MWLNLGPMSSNYRRQSASSSVQNNWRRHVELMPLVDVDRVCSLIQSVGFREGSCLNEIIRRLRRVWIISVDNDRGCVAVSSPRPGDSISFSQSGFSTACLRPRCRWDALSCRCYVIVVPDVHYRFPRAARTTITPVFIWESSPSWTHERRLSISTRCPDWQLPISTTYCSLPFLCEMIALPWQVIF